MRLPLELIIVIFIARRYALESGKPPENALLWATGAIIIGCVFLYLISLAGSAWSVRRLRKHPAERIRIYDAHSRLLVAEQILLVAAYLALAERTGWPALVVDEQGLNAGMTVIGDDLLQISPFMLGSLAIWLANYPASRALSPARWSLGEYLRGQARGMVFLLGPWMLMIAAYDSHIYWPEDVAALIENNAAVQLGAYLAMLLAIMVFFPFYMIHLWPCRRLPDGAVRGRLEALLARARVRCRELMVWRTGRGRIANAAVMGMVPWTRYIAFTDALLEDLDESEVEAVLAHELGHVRHHHMGFYLMFAVAFVLFAGLVFSLLPRELQTENYSWLMGMLWVVLVVFYWRVVFGFLSRRFERQADVASCELVGSPRPLMSALEKLARASGGSRTAGNWRHYSVAQRVAYLARFGFDGEALKEYHSYVRLVKGAAVVMVVLLAVTLAQKGEISLSQGPEATERKLLKHLEQHPHEYEKWAQLGRVQQMKLKKYSQAWKSFSEAAKTSFYPDGHLGLAMLSMERRSKFFNPKRAVEFAEEAVRRCEKSEYRKQLVIALRVRAEAAFLAMDYSLAVSSLREALSREPNNKELRARLKVVRAADERAGEQAKPLKGSRQSETSSD